jgi:hypothetical protein
MSYTFLPKFTFQPYILISVKRILFIICLVLFTTLLFAQNEPDKKSDKQTRREEKRRRTNSLIKAEEEGILAYNKQGVFGAELRTNGYGLFYERGKMRSPRYTNLYSIEISEIFHPKEEKINTDFFGNSFKYGKRNNFYQVKLGFGQQYIFGQKGNKNGVAVLGIAQAGVAVGLVKPYYLDVVDQSNEQRSVKYNSGDSLLFVSPGSITGASGPGKGWSDVKVNPGLFAKTALRFDFGSYNESITALEIGMSVEAYSRKVEQMLYINSHRFFYQGHIAIVFGSRK